MKGATEFSKLFETGQYGKMYIVSGSHARGRTFRIYILPEGEEAKGNGEQNPPLNKDAVNVYGVISGNPGWTEEYGWLRDGPWQADFKKMVKARRSARTKAHNKNEAAKKKVKDKEEIKEQTLLSQY